MATAQKPDDNVVLQYLAKKGQADRDNAMAQLDMQKHIDSINNAQVEDMTSVIAAGDAEASISAAKQARLARTDLNNLQAQTFLGLNPQEGSFRLEELARQRTENYAKANETAKVIAEKKSSTLLNDPLGFILNQFTLPADIAAHNYYASLHNNAAEEFDGIVDAGTKVGNENRSLAAATSAAEATGELALIAAKTNQQLAKLRVQTAQFNIQGIGELQKLKATDLNNAVTAVHVKESEERIQLQRQQMAATAEQRALVNAQRIALNEAKLEDKKQLEDTAMYYNLAAATDGTASMPAAVIIARLKREGPTGLTAQLINRGEDLAANQTAGKGGIPVAKNAGDAAIYYNRIGSNPVGPDKSTINFLMKRSVEVASSAELSLEKDPARKAAIIAKALVTEADKQRKLIDTDEANIYAAPSIAAIAKTVPAVLSNRFVKETLLPLAESSPSASVTPEQVYAMANAALAKDPSRLNEITQGVVGFYSAAVRTNNAQKGYAENGLPMQLGYNAAFKIGGQRVSVDMTDPLEIKRKFLVDSLKGRDPFGFGVREAQP